MALIRCLSWASLLHPPPALSPLLALLQVTNSGASSLVDVEVGGIFSELKPLATAYNSYAGSYEEALQILNSSTFSDYATSIAQVRDGSCGYAEVEVSILIPVIPNPFENGLDLYTP